MTEEELLISFSLSSETSFAQSNVDLNFTKGQFVVQRGNYVYEFGHNNINELFVLKIQLDRLKRRVRSVERCFTHVFDARSGVGQLFLDSVRSLPETLLHTEEEHYWRLGNMIIDLAGIAIEADDRALLSRGTTIQQAHIGRIEKYIRQNIQNPNLGTERVAEACGISVRYLHELFGQTGRTVGSWIRQQRLEMAKQEICDVSRRETIAEVAYRWGFGDQAQFSRNYKSFFGESPRETRARTAKERDFSD
ncbi:hypothetical protein GCM10011315_43080 [Roseovarius pacificus]|nr:hypothetical protein GCM10011315_43080 [Roseovarius pacificus]